MAEFFWLKAPLEHPTAPTLDDLRKGLNITSAITDANFTFNNTKEHTMVNIYQSALPGSTNTLRVTDVGVALYGGINAIDLKKEDLHAIAAEILAIGLDAKIGRFIPSASEYAAVYSEDELMRLAHRALQAVAKRRELDETKSKEEAARAKEDEYLNSPVAINGLSQYNEERWDDEKHSTWRTAYGDGEGFNISIMEVAQNWAARYESQQEYKHETLREAIANEFYDKPVFNLGSKALKAVDEIVSLRLQVAEALENQ